MKKLIMILIMIISSLAAYSQFNTGSGDGFSYLNIHTPFFTPPTITTNSIDGNSFCASSSLFVEFAVSSTFSSSNTFTAQLSDANGSFANPVTIGTLASTSSGTITATIPSNTPTGTGYRIRVVASDPQVTGSDNGSDLTISAITNIGIIGITTPRNLPLRYPAGMNTSVRANIVNYSASAQTLDNVWAEVYDNNYTSVASCSLTNVSLDASSTVTVQIGNVRINTAGTYSLKIFFNGNFCESDMSDNVYPRAGDPDYEFVIAYDMDAEAYQPLEPAQNQIISTTESIYPKFIFSNVGIADIESVPVSYRVTNVQTSQVIYNSNKTIALLAAGVNNSATGTFDLLTFPSAGTYHVTVDVSYQEDANSSNNRYEFNVEVYSITTDIEANSTMCFGSTVFIPFTANGSFNSSNTFTAQLSDKYGDFLNPTNIGALAGISSGTITATLPSKNTVGAGYRIRVVSSDPDITGTDNSSDITILYSTKSINLTLYLHGLWNGTVHKANVPVSVELRSGSTLISSTVVSVIPCLMNSSGAVTADFTEVADGSYYVVVRAAGYLPVALPYQVTLPICGTFSHNFTTAEAQSVSGNNVMIYSNGAYQVRGGDLNWDIWISTVDMNSYFKGNFGRQARSTIPGP